MKADQPVNPSFQGSMLSNSFWIRVHRVHNGVRFLKQRDILIDDGKIAAIADTQPHHSPVVNYAKYDAAPGFVDIQVNGGGGVFLDADLDEQSVATVAQAHRAAGVTSIVPTYISGPHRGISALLHAVEWFRGMNDDSVVAVHLEGPHISRARRGIHSLRHIRPLSSKDLREYCQLPARLAIPIVMTVAPEVVAPWQVAQLTEAGLVVSLGHSDCTAREAGLAIDAGATLATHLFNAMSQLQAREAGLVGAVLDDKRVSAGLIADGRHVAAETIAVAYTALGDRLVLISDALPPAAGGPDVFKLDGRMIRVIDGACRDESGTLAGSARTLAACAGWFASLPGVGAEAAVRAATSTPASALGIDQVGRLQPGGPANLVLLDSALEVKGVMYHGRWLHEPASHRD